MEAINFMSHPLYPQKRIPVPTEYKAGQSSEPLWAFLEKRKISCPYCGLSPEFQIYLISVTHYFSLINAVFPKHVNVMH